MPVSERRGHEDIFGLCVAAPALKEYLTASLGSSSGGDSWSWHNSGTSTDCVKQMTECLHGDGYELRMHVLPIIDEQHGLHPGGTMKRIRTVNAIQMKIDVTVTIEQAKGMADKLAGE